jgi:nicotinamide riboside transporter PnuC
MIMPDPTPPVDRSLFGKAPELMDAPTKPYTAWWEGYVALAWPIVWFSTVFIHHRIGAVIFYAMFVFTPIGLLCGLSAFRHGSPLQQICGAFGWIIAFLFYYVFFRHPRI